MFEAQLAIDIVRLERTGVCMQGARPEVVELSVEAVFTIG